MRSVYTASCTLLAILLVSCGSQPAVNPVGSWSGTAQGASGSEPVTLLITEPTGGVYEGVFIDVLSGATFLDLGCTVAGTQMRCEAEYPNDDASFAMAGPLADTRYTGELSAVFGVNTVAGTFELERAAQP